MNSAKVEKADADFLYGSVSNLVESCCSFCDKSIEKLESSLEEVYGKRRRLSAYIRKFHDECGTLTPSVKDAIKKLESEPCLLLMTAHQPNLFAYGGVMRRATLNYVISEKLSETLKLPIVNFFGIADQDFSDDRWVKSAMLPDVDRRKGMLELRFNLPSKIMLNRVKKPPRRVLDNWRSKVETWLEDKLGSIKRFCRLFKIEFSPKIHVVKKNFEEFWCIVEDAYKRAETYSDFNAFVMSKIVNEVWGYDTLFVRFSESQQLFERELCILLSRFDEYSQYVKEAISLGKGRERGVCKFEYQTIPFWLHCNCGSKARLLAKIEDGLLIGHGNCIKCRKKYEINFSSIKEPKISGIMHNISMRSLTMPLTFFSGLNVCCYVGGIGGRKYLQEAKYVADRMNLLFPPTVIWRPRDIYLGIGQLEALMTFRSFSGTLDLSDLPSVIAKLRKKIGDVRKRMEELTLYQKPTDNSDLRVLKTISMAKTRIKKEVRFRELTRRLKHLENVVEVMNLYPCIIDYAVNIGLKNISKQWIGFLRKNGSLRSDIKLQTSFDDVSLNLKWWTK
jgi:hypothetical protein